MRKIIGPYTKQKYAENDNGTSISKICYQENMIPVNTWKRTPLTKQEKRDPAKQRTWRNKKQIGNNNLNTWVIQNGQIQRQIDYIIINNRYRNMVTTTIEKQGWRGNMTQQRQHAVIKMDIKPRLARNYYKKIPPETGTYMKYDIKTLRLEPNKIEKWRTDTEQKWKK